MLVYGAVLGYGEFQSTLSVRRATEDRGILFRVLMISIHALRKESDATANAMPAIRLFQSTLSVRRATQANQINGYEGDISIHALRKESDGEHVGQHRQVHISIHALRKESDHGQPAAPSGATDFNPRSP